MAERGYSFSLTTFSPSGKLVQIEYALAAVAAGAPSVGIKVYVGPKEFVTQVRTYKGKQNVEGPGWMVER